MDTEDLLFASAKLPSSLLRQHAARFTEGAVTLEDYREKRAQILNNILTMYAPVIHTNSVPTLVSDINFGSIRKSQRGHTAPQALTSSRIVLLSVLSFTAALMSLLPNARTTITAITSTLALTAPTVLAARQLNETSLPGNRFQDHAMRMAGKERWSGEDIELTLRIWSDLNEEQRYSARRYTGYNQLLSSASSRAAEFRELAEVSTLSASLEMRAQEIERITNALLNNMP